MGNSYRATGDHDQPVDGADSELYGGWPIVLSGLKTLLETGEPSTGGEQRAPARCPVLS